MAVPGETVNPPLFWIALARAEQSARMVNIPLFFEDNNRQAKASLPLGFGPPVPLLQYVVQGAPQRSMLRFVRLLSVFALRDERRELSSWHWPCVNKTPSMEVELAMVSVPETHSGTDCQQTIREYNVVKYIPAGDLMAPGIAVELAKVAMKAKDIIEAKDIMLICDWK